MLTSSEVAIVKLLDLLIHSSRADQVQGKGECESTPGMLFSSVEFPIALLNFVADLYTTERLDKFVDCRAFLKALEYYVPPDSGISEKIYESLCFDTVDDLNNMMDSIPSLLVAPDNVNPNGTMSPFVVMPGSMLGLILRSISVKWENTLFESACTMFDRFKMFLNQSESMDLYEDLGEYDVSKMGEMGTCRHGMFHAGDKSYLDQSDEYAKFHDIVPAMDTLHKYYDMGSQDIHLFTDLLSSGGPNPSKRHQQAMLTMASVWVRSGNSARATCAVEEALKQAHQRGDHASVSQALLLLQHILVLSNDFNSPSSRKSIEATLERLITRCNDLKLRVFAAQARLLLVRVKIKGVLNATEVGLASDTEEFVDPAMIASKNGCSPQEIWNSLLLVQLGENVASERTVNSHAMGATEKDSSADGPLSSDELGIMSLSISVVSADFWCRLGLYEMAELECRRGIRKYSRISRHGREEMVLVTCQCARLRAMTAHGNSTLTLFFGSFDRVAAVKACVKALGLLALLQTLLCIDPIEPLYKHFKVTLVTIQIWQAISAKNIPLAMDLCAILIELLEPETLSSSAPDLEYIQARMLYALILEYMNPNRAALEFLNILEISAKYNMTELHGEATLLHTIAQFKLCPYDLIPSKRTVQSVKEIGKSQLYPTLESLASISEKIILGISQEHNDNGHDGHRSCQY